MGFLIYILNIQNFDYFTFLKKNQILSYKFSGPEKGNMILSQNCRVVFFSKSTSSYENTQIRKECSQHALSEHLFFIRKPTALAPFEEHFHPVFFQFGLKLILHAKVSGEEKCRNWCRKMGTNIAISGIHKNLKKKSEKKTFIDLFFVIWPPLSGNYAFFFLL